ncbi:MAG: PRC-barrel domain-containing protein [Terriglobales bacterium]
MAHLGRLHGHRFTSGSEIDDIRGSNVYGVEDKKLGKIDDVIFDHLSGDIKYVVVDTGGLLSTKRFIVPADRLMKSVEHENDYAVNLTKEQIETFPPYDENAVEAQDRWKDYETRYRAAWTDTPVQHRAGSDKNISPDLGERWKRFGTRLRSERDVIVGGCSICTPGRKSVEQPSRERKVG